VSDTRAERQLYTDDEERPVFRDSFVAYLDSLGTKVRTSRMTDEDLHRHLDRLEGNQWFLHDDSSSDSERQSFLSFSDNVVVGLPIDDEQIAGEMILLVEAVAMYQLNETVLDIFLRGAVTRGPLYMSRKIAIGAALNDAVELEENTANFPRVLVSGSCRTVIQGDEDWRATNGFSSWRQMLVEDEDGEFFVNYLIVVEYDGDEEIFPGLERHTRAVIHGLDEFALVPRVRSKYVWAAKYHNFFIDQFYPECEELKIGLPALSQLEINEPRNFKLLSWTGEGSVYETFG